MTHPPGQPGGGGGSGGGTTGPGREIQTFQFGDLPLRTVMVGGEPWFVTADALAPLGLNRSSLAALDDDEKGVQSLYTLGGYQQMSIISEAGLYSLILRSRKPEAKAFKRWITHDVLPAIRRTGSYTAPAADLDELEVARRYVLALEAKKAIEAELAIAAPKAHSWDTLASGDGDFSVGDAAKILSRDPVIAVGERRLFTVLSDHGWIYRGGDGRWRVYQSAIEAGRLSELPSSHYHPRTGELVLDPPQVRVTPKGLAELHRRLGGMQPLRMHEQIALPAP
ncbi:phage antirepressor KilAC domain-containing protein [Micromonospora sp. CB01531]|uniref:phage antirepressor KilAC domain-containing protein n=1 Tax=Micromonospora sp. CB01531 TaxID=1718947 RepID=UPI00093D461E|nr:phage antirepressor KilAC domain-containing protein [Micromonospora sp. CB01531]OKI47260.1 phage antirepressor protein [Micromonospora sp. CB01531]